MWRFQAKDPFRWPQAKPFGDTKGPSFSQPERYTTRKLFRSVTRYRKFLKAFCVTLPGPAADQREPHRVRRFATLTKVSHHLEPSLECHFPPQGQVRSLGELINARRVR